MEMSESVIDQKTSFVRPVVQYYAKEAKPTWFPNMLKPDESWILQYLRSYGHNSFSGCLLYEGINYYRLQRCEGFVGYVKSDRIFVSFGEPVCAPENYRLAAEEFINHAQTVRASVVFALVGGGFVKATEGISWSKAVVGDDMIFDLPRYKPSGDHAKKVRSARNQAVKRGARVLEYRRSSGRDSALEAQIEGVCQRWLKSLPKYQLRLLSLDLFKMADLKRYFYVEFSGKLVAVLTCLPIFARNGFLFEDLIRDPDAPNGATELLILEAIRILRDEGVQIATMGLSPRVQLHRSWGFLWWQVGVVRFGVRLVRGLSGLDRLYHYRKKFHAGSTEINYLLKHPVGVGARDLLGIIRAFDD
jgi:lysylphosphatidylglycerol synthetase-like protein (DUF2156 family)